MWIVSLRLAGGRAGGRAGPVGQLGDGWPCLWRVVVMLVGRVFVLLLEGDGFVGAGGGDDCVLSKNKSGELRLNLSRS